MSYIRSPPAAIHLAYQCYQAREYSQALKHYAAALSQPNKPWIKLTIHYSIAIIHIHLCDYNEAYILLHDLLKQLNPNQHLPENKLILLKVHSSLALINVINAQASVAYEHIQQCLNIIKESQNTLAMFKTLLQSLYGFGSFRQMHILSNSLINDESYLQNGIMCSAMAMNREICGANNQTAFKLQNKAYEKFRHKKQTILCIISLRHLIHLSKQLKLSRNVLEAYHKQLQAAMSQQQISGVSESTLFRNYEDKIKIAKKITEKLFYFQNQQLKRLINTSIDINFEELSKKQAIILKLKKMRNASNYESINRTIQMVMECQDNMLTFLQKIGSSKLLKNAVQQFETSTNKIVELLTIAIMRNFYIKVFETIEGKDQNRQRSSSEKKRNKKRQQYGTVLKKTQISPQPKRPLIQIKAAIPFNEQHQIQYINQQTSELHKKPTGVFPTPYQNQTNHSVEQKQKKQHIGLHQQYNMGIITSSSPPRLHKQQIVQSNLTLIPVKRDNVHMPPSQIRYYPCSQIHPNAQKITFNYSPSKIIQRQQRSVSPQFSPFQRNITHLNRTQYSPHRDQIINRQNASYIQNVEQQKMLQQMNQSRKIQQYERLKQSAAIKRSLIFHGPIDPNRKMEPAQSMFMRPQIPKSNIQTIPQQNKISQQNKIPNEQEKMIPKEQRIIENQQKKIQENRKKQIRSNAQTIIQHLMNKAIKLCFLGQYVMKRHFSSDGGEEKFFQLTKTHFKWSYDEKKIATKFQSYPLKDIKGIVMGKITETMLKECNKKLEPWKCFSLILKKRTLDLYCPQERDLQFWIPGISAMLSTYSTPFAPIVPSRPGKIIWKRVLSKFRYYYLGEHAHGSSKSKIQKKYRNANAYAIILFGKDTGKLKQSKLSKISKH